MKHMWTLARTVNSFKVYIKHFNCYSEMVNTHSMKVVECQYLVCGSAGNENYTGIAARDTANALRVLAGAVRGVAAGTKNQQTQEYILSTAQQVGGRRGGAE